MPSDFKKSNSKTDLNNDSSDSSTTFSGIFANNQSTKDLTSSPYLAASKFQILTSSVSTTTSSSSFNKKKSMSLQPRTINPNIVKMKNIYKNERKIIKVNFDFFPQLDFICVSIGMKYSNSQGFDTRL